MPDKPCLDEEKAKTALSRVDDPKKLNPRPMQLLLKHAFTTKDPSKCFLKTLLISKDFVNVARYFQVYRFGVKVRRYSLLFYFENDKNTETNPFSLGSASVHRLFCLLNPPFVSFMDGAREYCTFLEQDINDYLNLLDLTTGKIGLYFSEEFTSESFYIEKDWSRLAELKCHASALLGDVPSKDFDLLHVEDVQSITDLRAILCHNAKKLILKFSDYFNPSVDAAIQEAGRIECCALFASSSNVLKATKLLARSVPSLKKFTVEANYMGRFAAPNNYLVERIIQQHSIYDQLIQFLRQTSVDCEVLFSFKCFSRTNEHVLGELKTRDEFSSLQQVYSGRYGDLVMEQTRANVHGRFCIEFGNYVF